VTTRRQFLAGTLAALLPTTARTSAAQDAGPAVSYPIGLPGRVLGDGFLVRHGYATENTWYNPGWLHCGEDWYAIEGDTAGAAVYAVAAGEVVFAGSEYPGLVVIVRHGPDLFSMYGHLADDFAVEPGQPVDRGALLGTVLARTDGRAPSHLHFEARTFLTHPEVNGDAPRYEVGCGYRCPPGPGYWPIGDPEHPSVIGWRNPTHFINARAFAPLDRMSASRSAVVVAAGAAGEVDLWPAAAAERGERIASLPLVPGDRHALIGVDVGDPASEGTSAEAYRLRYRLALPDGSEGWVDAVEPADIDTGADGRPSALRFRLLPAITAD